MMWNATATVAYLSFTVGSEIVHFFNILQLDYVTRHRDTNMPCGTTL